RQQDVRRLFQVPLWRAGKENLTTIGVETVGRLDPVPRRTHSTGRITAVEAGSTAGKESP
ncbi:MAG: hypothetical protein ACR2LI_08295, partial [Propionibacteriaceae bacterium]